MSEKLNHLNQLLKRYLQLSLSISIGVFLFILFFHPFSIDRFEQNDWLIFVAGMSAIIFSLIFIIRVGLPFIIYKNLRSNYKPSVLYYINGVILFFANSLALSFYLHYVGLVDVTFDVLFKVFFISMVSPIILRLYDLYKRLSEHNVFLLKESKYKQKQIESYETDYQNISIQLLSESNKETIELQIANIAFIQSADNYVEIVYKEGESFKKKLIRNTLKNIEQQIKSYSNFIRCHRTCIINKYFVEKLNKEHNKSWLTINDYDEVIPVSIQYLAKLKESL
jgi:hypothetical protein